MGQNRPFPTTILHCAIRNNHIEFVPFLLAQNECNVSAKDIYGKTPLSLLFIHACFIAVFKMIETRDF